MSNQTFSRALKNIFEDNSTKTIFGKVIQRISSSKFKILDDIDREIIVSADREWSIGTYVIAQNNVIIRSGKRAGDFKTFKV